MVQQLQLKQRKASEGETPGGSKVSTFVLQKGPAGIDGILSPGQAGCSPFHREAGKVRRASK